MGQSEKTFRRESIRFINMKHIGNSHYILSSCNLYRPVLVLLCKIDKRIYVSGILCRLFYYRWNGFACCFYLADDNLLHVSFYRSLYITRLAQKVENVSELSRFCKEDVRYRLYFCTMNNQRKKLRWVKKSA